MKNNIKSLSSQLTTRGVSYQSSSTNHLPIIYQSSTNHLPIIYQSSTNHLPIICLKAKALIWQKLSVKNKNP
ncbi:MAG: hypothetical protein ACR9NN_09670 [Nostochopsis sp.]